jgi:hypothetical protein
MSPKKSLISGRIAKKGYAINAFSMEKFFFE